VRDRADFESYVGLLAEGQVEYHIDLNFQVNDGELVIIDEADFLIYDDPEKFRDFAAKCACICFTATPDDQDPLGMEIKVL